MMKLGIDIVGEIARIMQAETRAGEKAVTTAKRLDLARDAERARDAVPGLIVANWGEPRL